MCEDTKIQTNMITSFLQVNNTNIQYLNDKMVNASNCVCCVKVKNHLLEVHDCKREIRLA